ncbi:MAG: VWA domain-containing protein [Lachnospiraceae bacterium]|nr:VWA domain-containing protein [Lachnospiraceae bacterium]
MKKNILRKTAYVLAFTMLIETAVINLDTKVFSKESISLEEIKLLKENAIDWLKESQNEDGSFGGKLHNYYTTQLLENLAYQDDIDDEKTAAFLWLEDREVKSNDDLFRKYLAKKKSGDNTNEHISVIDTDKLQNRDGGFGLMEGYTSDVLDTVLAINCMMESDNDNIESINNSLSYLKKNQMSDGGFSYASETSNVYLTAYTYKTVSSFLDECADSSVKTMTEKCSDYLLSIEDESQLWGLEEESIRDSLMATISFVADDEETLKRIAIIAENVADDGSIYEDVELTSLFVSLVNEYEIMTGNSDYSQTKIKDVKIVADKERIGAYTPVRFDATVLGMKNDYKLIAVVSGNDGYVKILDEEEDGEFLWNTENNTGSFEVVISVIDKNDGSIVTSKTKNIKVYDTFDVTAVSLNVSPRAYKLGCGKTIKIATSAHILSNVKKEVTSEIIVKDEAGNILFTDNKKSIGGCKNRELYFEEVSFKPEIEKTTFLNVTVNIKADGKVLNTKTGVIKVYESEDENRIDIDYDVSSDYIYPDTDEANVSFKLSGKGLSETVKRRPMDVVIILDNSGSMGRQDWLKAIEGAKIIIDYMQPQDRAEIRYINKDAVQIPFSNDKEYLKTELDKRSNQSLWSGTPVYKSLNLSVKDFTEEDRDRAVYIFTDGVRDGDVSTLNEQDLIDNKIKVYSVFMECNASASAVAKATEIMNHIADFTGGMALNVPTNDKIASCVTDLLGDLFKMAGKDVKLSMTVDKDIPIDNLTFETDPNETVENEDGSTTISFDKNYISVGEDWELNLKYILSNLTFDEKLKLLTGIVFSYKDENDETVEINLGDIVLDVVTDYSDEIPASVNEEENNDETDKIEVMMESDGSKFLSHNKPEVTEKEQRELISGNIALSESEAFVGDEISAYVGVNKEESDRKTVNTKVVLIDTKDSNNTKSFEQTVSVSDSDKSEIAINTDNLYEGNYVAILMADINGEMTALDASGVTLNEHRYKFTVEQSDGGSVDIKADNFKSGEIVNVKAIADEGYIFDKWVSEDVEIENEDVNRSEISIVMPAKAVNLKAVFVKKTSESGLSNEEDKQADIISNGGKTNNLPKKGNVSVEKTSESDDKNSDSETKVTDVKNVTQNNNKHSSEEKHITQNSNSNKEINKAKDYQESDKKANIFANLTSPLTGDFTSRDIIRLLLLIQSIALICICICLKRGLKEELK